MFFDFVLFDSTHMFLYLMLLTWIKSGAASSLPNLPTPKGFNVLPHPFPKIRNRVPCPDTKCAVIYYSHDMMKVCCDRRQLEDDSVHKAP